jgi:glycosyltransferase involved in cell wall biosynthesis
MSADVVVVPSLSEGFGFVGAEISALGKKALIARSGALPEVASGDIHFFDTESSLQLTHLLQLAYEGQSSISYQTTYQYHGNMRRIQALYHALLSGTS